MPENVWPLINIVNYIFLQEETVKNKLVPSKRLIKCYFLSRTLYLTVLLLDHVMTTPNN